MVTITSSQGSERPETITRTTEGSAANRNDEAGQNSAESRRDVWLAGQRWAPILSNGITVLGVACAAAYTSTHVVDQGVGITAWVAVAVVGTASSIAAARPRDPRVARDPRVVKEKHDQP